MATTLFPEPAMTTPLTLIATLTARDGQAAAIEAGLHQLVEPSRAEPGCLQYDLHRHQDTPRVFVMIEQWRDAAALEEHRQSAHYLAFASACGDRLQDLDLQFIQRIA